MSQTNKQYRNSSSNGLVEILRNASSWDGVKSYISSIKGTTAMGETFELFCRGYYLATQEGFTAAHSIRNLPEKLKDSFPGNDHGVDLVLERLDGTYIPVQCKFTKNQDKKLSWTKDRLANFFAETADFERIILFSSAAVIDGHSATRYGNKLSIVMGHDLQRLTAEDLKRIADVIDSENPVSTPSPKKSPRDYQETAIRKVVEGFASGASRGQLILPCGTGKTLIAQWIRENMGVGADRTLVVVPSLQLLKQTLEEWRTNTSSDFDYLCVCSEEDIDQKSREDLTHLSSMEVDAAGNVTTNPVQIRAFLASKTAGRGVVVFSTYQSLFRVSKAVAGIDELTFDLVICDEAHKTAGVKAASGESGESGFTLVHEDKFIPTKKRLYMTATPRILSRASKKSLDAGTLERIADMSNEEIFGAEFHRMGFEEAISKGCLTDYKIIGVGVTDKEIEKVLADYPSEDLWLLACAVAAAKVSVNRKISHGISFHSSVLKATRFKEILAGVLGKAAPEGGSSVSHVNGDMSAASRSNMLREFASKKGVNFMTNARCLTEGVDVPQVDGVFFCDPKSSVVDIVQAVGRALRTSPGKETGYIVVPLFHGKDEVTEKTIDESMFSSLVRVIRSMAANDARLDDELKVIYLNGKGRSGGAGAGNGGSAVVVGQRIAIEGFEWKLADSIFDQVIGRVIDSAALNKKALMEWSDKSKPKNHAKDPTEKRLAKFLSRYLSESEKSYDAKFAKDIKKAKPIWFIDTAEDNKKALMEWRSDKRPNGGSDDLVEKKLGQSITRYTKESSDSYDPEFTAKIKAEKPLWFFDTSKANKDALLAWNNEKRPSSTAKDPVEKRLGQALKSYIISSANAYDEKFSVEIRSKKPLWFVNTAAANKEELLSWNSQKRPNARSKDPVEKRLGIAVHAYTSASTNSYDEKFSEEIRGKKPLWFIDTVSINKEALLAWNDNKIPTSASKNPVEKKLGACLRNYINESSSSYDEKFSIEIRSKKPLWFIDTVALNKAAIMAWSGDSRPSKHSKDPEERRLGAILSNYISRLSSSYQEAFFEELAKVKPRWFADIVTENKRALLAWDNEKRPNARSENETEKRLGAALGRYIAESSDSYDSNFMTEIKASKPLWFNKTNNQKDE